VASDHEEDEDRSASNDHELVPSLPSGLSSGILYGLVLVAVGAILYLVRAVTYHYVPLTGIISVSAVTATDH
jgi:hypothetical protein